MQVEKKVPTFRLYVNTMQRVVTERRHTAPTLAATTTRLRPAAGASDLELSFTALKSVTPGNETQLNVENILQFH